MLTFAQFMAEAALSSQLSELEHSFCSNFRDWGIIHPKTGKIISGTNHNTAGTHYNLKLNNIFHSKNPTREEWKKAPEWGLVHDRPDHEGNSRGYLFVRHVRDDNRDLVRNTLKDLPSHPSGHVIVNNRAFDNERKAYNHLKNGDLSESRQ